MFRQDSEDPQHQFVETRVGIVTRNRDWFHITSEYIERYVPGLLEVVSLEKLIGDAETWVRSADSLTLVLVLVLLFFINPWLAALIGLAFHWLWYNYKSGFVNRPMSKLLVFINSDGFLLIISFVALSLLGVSGNYVAATIGIIYFFLMKLRLLKMGWDALIKDQKESLTLNDRVLKMVIVKHAIHKDVAPPEVESMEDRIKEIALKLKRNRG